LSAIVGNADVSKSVSLGGRLRQNSLNKNSPKSRADTAFELGGQTEIRNSRHGGEHGN